jgi:hypothetical protein
VKNARTGFLERNFYLLMALLIVVVVVYGFSQTIDQNLLHPKIPRPRLLYFHAAVFTAWLVFFTIQTILVRTNNVRIHRTIGWFGVGLGALIPTVGVATALTMARFNMTQLHQANADADIIIPMWDMVAFTAVFVPAVLWRKKREFHKRLMLTATCVLTAAAWGRFPEWLLPPILFYGGVDLLISLGALRDWLVSRRVHPVYLYVLPILIAGQTLVMYVIIHKSAAWIRIAHALVR